MEYGEKYRLFSERHPYLTVNAGGADWRYVFCGNGMGRDLVFLNGGMNLSEMWMDYVDEFSGTDRVLIFDYPRELTTCEELAEGMHALFEKLGIRKPILIGASFGGMEAQVYARRYSAEMGGMILLSTGGIDRKTLRSLRMKYFLTPLLIRYMKRCDYEKLKPKLIESGAAHAKDESPEIKAYVRDMFTFLFRDYTKEKDIHATGLLWDITRVEPVVAEDFEALRGRIMMMLPKADFFSPRMQKDLIALMHGPEITYMDGGHVSTVIRPKAYIGAIRKFIGKI